MRTLTLHIELFVHHSLLFRLYNLLCRTAQHAQPFVPKVNLICTNIFMCKVLRKNNFSSNHSTSKNLITKIQNYLKMSSEKDVAYIPPSKRTVGFTLLHIKNKKNGKNSKKRKGKHTSYRDWETDRKSTRLNSSHITRSRMPSSA